jgi:hypothetical protein
MLLRQMEDGMYEPSAAGCPICDLASVSHPASGNLFDIECPACGHYIINVTAKQLAEIYPHLRQTALDNAKRAATFGKLPYIGSREFNL